MTKVYCKILYCACNEKGICIKKEIHIGDDSECKA